MDTSQVRKLLDPQFGKIGKSSGEQLWAHHFASYTVVRAFAQRVPNLSDRERLCLELSALTHDIGKMREEWQRKILTHPESLPPHKPEQEETEEYLLRHADGLGLTAEDRKAVWDITRTHHYVSESDLQQASIDRLGFLVYLFMRADHIASMDQPNLDYLAELNDFYNDRGVAFTAFEFSRFPSPTSYLVLHQTLKAYKEAGWDVLTVCETGAIFIGTPKTPLPEKEQLTNSIFNEFLKQSLRLQKPDARNFTKDLLSGMSVEHPLAYLETHGAEIKDDLGDAIKKPLLFLKLCKELLDKNNQITDKILRELPVLDILRSVSGTNNVNARPKFEAWAKSAPPDKLDKNFIKEVFDKTRIGELLPESLYFGHASQASLSSLQPAQLYNVLLDIARPLDQETELDRRLKHYINQSLTMEQTGGTESNGFRAIANEIFNRYKIYKRTDNPERGVCERCACPVSIRMQRTAQMFKDKSTATSQIRSRNADRATCPLCVFDNLFVRREGYSAVYVRIETRVPDLLAHVGEVTKLVARIRDGLRFPGDIVRLEERPELSNVPFPKRIHVPISSDEVSKRAEDVEIVMETDRGPILRISKMSDGAQPKDLRAQFEPLYHVLNFLGFQVNIGLEEQTGLFGERIETTPESYYLSLATVLLASVVNKKTGRFIFAKILLEKNPSVALTTAAGDGREHYGLNEKLLPTFIESVMQANMVIGSSKGGEISMKELLHDAAFLADREKGIPFFCERSQDGGFLTKHKATKPIAQALDEIMLGRPAEMALERFLRTLRDNIAAERQQDLTNFVAGVRDIMKRYQLLREESVTDFLKAKNGLLSAVFTLTRYPNLIEEVTKP